MEQDLLNSALSNGTNLIILDGENITYPNNPDIEVSYTCDDSVHV